MLREHVKLVHRIAILIDSLVIGIAFLSAYVICIYFQYSFIEMKNTASILPPLSYYLLLFLIVIPTWIVTLSYSGIYREMRKKGFTDIFLGVFTATFLSLLILSSIMFLLDSKILSPIFVLIFYGSAFSLLVTEKGLALVLLHHIRQIGYNFKRVIIIGSGERAKNFIRIISSHPYWGCKIIGLIDEPDRIGMTVEGYKVIGSFDNIAGILEENAIDEVIFVLPRKFLSEIEDYIIICENIGVTVTIPVDFFNTAIAKPALTSFHGWPVLTLRTTPLDNLDLAVKRIIDLVVAATGIILLSPFFAVIALLIKITSNGPVFFKQVRCGLYGRKFVIFKFRTMVTDAEERFKELKGFNELDGPAFKMKDDPRVIGIGRFLRKSSLDELPQLFNVLKGDMSLIGPRPPLPDEVENYESWQRRRLSLRPGMACIHEVVARNDKNFHKWMKLDLEYIDNWSLSMDIMIFLNVILAPFKAKGV